jgi:hypothetical protein
VVESKGERVFESGEDSLCEMVCRVGKLIEVEAFSREGHQAMVCQRK